VIIAAQGDRLLYPRLVAAGAVHASSSHVSDTSLLEAVDAALGRR
jgi:hypothetical protein